jgi:protein phosphatase methylesterase 1
MSDLYRAALSARISKQSAQPTSAKDVYGEDDDEEEAEDGIGALPGSGLGPPAMQVS